MCVCVLALQVERLLKVLETPYSHQTELTTATTRGSQDTEESSPSAGGCRAEEGTLADYMKRPPIESLDARVT